MAPFPQASPRQSEICARLLIRLFVRAMLKASSGNISISTSRDVVDAHTDNIGSLHRSVKAGDATFDTSESPCVEGSLGTLLTRLWRLLGAICVWLDTPRFSHACLRFSRRPLPPRRALVHLGLQSDWLDADLPGSVCQHSLHCLWLVVSS